MFQRTEANDHRRVGEPGLRDAEAMDENLFVALGSQAQKDVPDVVALANAAHQVRRAIVLRKRGRLREALETDAMAVEKIGKRTPERTGGQAAEEIDVGLGNLGAVSQQRRTFTVFEDPALDPESELPLRGDLLGDHDFAGRL